jgi:opacity protein-like surface antigen
MNTNPASRLAAALAAACGLLTCVPAFAQPDNQPAPAGPAAPETPVNTPPGATSTAPAPAGAASGPASASDARDALKKQAGDVDQSTLLKDTLTKSERQYSLLKAGRIGMNYDLNYSYEGSEAINEGFDTTGAIDLFKIETTRAHTVTNSLSFDYGLMDNLTVNTTIPLVSKFTQSPEFGGVANALGDITLGGRYQPFVQTPGGPTFTVTGQLSLPTGRSPFDMVMGHNLATGAGYASGTVGLNASQVYDPVALFGSVNFTEAASANGLHQYNPADGSTLTKVKPGKSVGIGAGFTYALSYNISTSVSFQETVTTASTVTFRDSSNNVASRQTAQQVAAILNFGLGVRLNPKTTINLSAGVGLTTDSPDFSLGLDVPLTFSFF